MNLHIVRNPVSFDSRVLKETACVAESGIFNEVEICGFHEPGYPLHEQFGHRVISRIKLITRALPKNLVGQLIKYIEWYVRIINRYRHSSIELIHCHDLAPLLIAVRLKHWHGAKLIYDAHELETETMGMRGLRQRLARWLERHLMNQVDALITVSPSIRSWYQSRFPRVAVYLVRNIPALPDKVYEAPSLRREFHVPEHALLGVYLGSLGHGRGIEPLLAAFAKSDVTHHIVFMGAGPLLETIRSYQAQSNNIHYCPPVAPAQVIAYAGSADIGLCLIEAACLNYRYCLPNKLFEMLLAGLPVLASNLPDQAAIVEEYQAGWVVDNNVDAIVQQLALLSKADCLAVQRGLQERIRELSWTNESIMLLRAYRDLLA